MILSDTDIMKAVRDGDITITGFTKNRLQPASYDILLDDHFMMTESYRDGYIDPHKKKFPEMREIQMKKNEKFTLHPGVSVLGRSRDYIGSDRYLIQLSGKSSLARIGLIIHNTAGIINPGHYLQVTLELYNLNNIPIVLTPGMAIAQLTFSKLLTEPKRNYRELGRYTDSNWQGAIAPRGGRKKRTPRKKK
jgi:dCTP deaminase